MVGAPESLALPLREPAVDVLQLNGIHSQTFGNASQGATTVHTTAMMHAMSRMFFTKFF
jgi:hypothetical protein